MPGWVQAIFVVAAVGMVGVGAVVAYEVRRLARCLNKIGPQLDHLGNVFSGWPDHFGVLDEILAQFRTNSGHTLRDIVNKLFDILTRLETASTVAASAADRMEALIGHLDAKVSMTAATGLRIEGEQQDVAEDLAAAQQRADDAHGDPDGAQADAASRSPEEAP